MSNVRGRKSPEETPHVPEGRQAPVGGMGGILGGDEVEGLIPEDIKPYEARTPSLGVGKL